MVDFRRSRWLARIGLPTLLGWAVIAAGPVRSEESWFVSFESVFVGPVMRNDVTQWVDAGTIETDGFTELVFSFGGEFKEALPSGGQIGAILLPDEEVFDYLLRNEGQIVFPLEAKKNVAGLKAHLFVTEQQTALVAFPRYRVYFYNETGSAAKVSLFVYRSRR